MRIILENFYFTIERAAKTIVKKLSIVRSRNIAHRRRRQLIEKKGETVIDKQLKKNIKEYAKKRFGKTDYWPWLAFYTEIRGQFVKGWIPEDYYQYVWEPKNNPLVYSSISEQKTFDHRIFDGFSIKPLFVYISNVFYDSESNKLNSSELSKILSDYNDIIVVKEDFSMGGEKVSFFHSSEFEPERLVRNKNYVIQPYIKQFKVLNDLYPNSVNTFRVITFLNTEGLVSVKYVILRFGVNGSKVDNLSSGGQFVYFDPSGNPSECAYDENGYCKGKRHINTGFLFSELKIPILECIKDLCKEAHRKFPYVRLIAWDVCIDNYAEPKLIEWNAFRPGIYPTDAIFGPFWANELF